MVLLIAKNRNILINRRIMVNHLSHMVLDRAKKYQDRVVFRYQNQETNSIDTRDWNYFGQKTKEVSLALLSLGFGHDSKIGIFGNNRPEWTIADIGILSIRAIVVPFYGTSSHDQLKYIVDETEMELMFVDDEVQLKKAIALLDKSSLQKIVSFSNLNINHEAVISWDEFCKLGKEKDEPLLEEALNNANEEDIASLIYTSGTTGEPKGAMLSHLNFMHCFKINDKRLDITEDDISLAFLPLSHIFERSWTLFFLYKGAVNTFLCDPKKIIEFLPKAKPTVMCVVPRFFEKTHDGIMEEYLRWPSFKQKIFNWSVSIGQKTIGKDKLSFPLNIKHKLANKLVLGKMKEVFGGNLRTTPCAGAAIRPDLLTFFHSIGIFVNYGYGATETTATVSCMKTDKFDLNTCGSIMPETNVTIGENDEIIIEGDTVFKGYFKKPEETAKVLSGKTFKSGDQGYITDDNYLIMTDRIKDLMKTSGGKYISPQKLELLIGQNKYVEQIVVVGDQRRFVSALIVPNMEQLKLTQKELGLDDESNVSIVNHPLVNEFFKAIINHDQSHIDSYEQIKKFTLLPEPFSIENNGLTNTLKLKRKHITAECSEIIEEMYK